MEPVTREVWVTGRKHYQQALSTLGEGEHEVELVHEPSNPHDANAVRIDALRDAARLKIGYIPAEISVSLVPVLAAEGTTTAKGKVVVIPPSGRKMWAARLTAAGLS